MFVIGDRDFSKAEPYYFHDKYKKEDQRGVSELSNCEKSKFPSYIYIIYTFNCL